METVHTATSPGQAGQAQAQFYVVGIICAEAGLGFLFRVPRRMQEKKKHV